MAAADVARAAAAGNRVAYIRTIINKECPYSENDTYSLISWLEFWVWQNPTPQPGSKAAPTPTHHFILGQTTAGDVVVLDWLIGKLDASYSNLTIDDFTVYLSSSQLSELKNKALLDRLRERGVRTEVVDSASSLELPGDGVCDAAMLSKCDYVLESFQHNSRFPFPFDYRWRTSLRQGSSQIVDNEEANYNYFRFRRANKMGHTATSDYCCCPERKCEHFRRDHKEKWDNYKCPACGQRCKRNKGCAKTGEVWYESKVSRWTKEVDTSAPRPPDFEAQWRELSAQDVLHPWYLDHDTLERFRNWKWKSVDTFSGE